MKSIFIALPIVLFAHFVQAAPAVKCDVRNLKEADVCMIGVSESIPEYEGSNDWYSAAGTKELVKALKILGMSPAQLKKASAFDFTGLVVQHGDEHHVFYYGLNKGKAVKPVKLYELNIADLSVDSGTPDRVDAMKASTYLLGLVPKDDHVYEDFETALRALAEEEAESAPTPVDVKPKRPKLKCQGLGLHVLAKRARTTIKDFLKTQKPSWSCKHVDSPEIEELQYSDGKEMVGIQLEIKDDGKCKVLEVYTGPIQIIDPDEDALRCQ